MTEVAIKKLSQNPNGYYLFVEAGKIGKGFNLKLSRLWKSSIEIHILWRFIFYNAFSFFRKSWLDHGHHDGNPVRALYDFVAFDKAIGKARGMIDMDETLVIITGKRSRSRPWSRISKFCIAISVPSPRFSVPVPSPHFNPFLPVI